MINLIEGIYPRANMLDAPHKTKTKSNLNLSLYYIIIVTTTCSFNLTRI